MPDTSKPNPNYVNAPFEIGEWTPETGPVHWKEVGRNGDTLVLEGRTEDGRVLRKEWRYIPDGPVGGLYKPADWKGETDFHRCPHLNALDNEVETLKYELRRCREERDRLFKELAEMRANRDYMIAARDSARQERDRLIEHIAEREKISTSAKAEGIEVICVKGGKLLSSEEAVHCIESAMRIIESVGTTGIHDKCQQAHNWMMRYFPNWA